MKAIAALLALAALLIGAASAQTGEVLTYNNLDDSPKRFTLVSAATSTPRPHGNHALHLQLVRQQLLAQGWIETAFEAADVAVFVQCALGNAHNEALNHPIVVPRPDGSLAAAPAAEVFSIRRVAVRSEGDPAAGGGLHSLERTLRIEMFAARPFIQDMTMVPVFDATVRSMGSGTLDEAMPELVRAAFTGFPGISEKQVSARSE